MKVKAITLWQPWATLVATGAKQFETRSWMTTYRGWLAIHAAKTKKGRAFCDRLITNTLTSAGYAAFDHLPFGCIVALVNLQTINTTELIRQANYLNSHELAFGDYSNGRYAWKLEVIRKFDPPIPARGRQRLWTWEDETIREED